MKAWLCGFMLIVSLVAGAHPTGKKKPPTKASVAIAASAKALEAYRKSLTEKGRYSCCVKPPPKSKVDGCALCAIKTGSCECGVNLANGKGVCGECKGMWMGGKGSYSIAYTPYKKAADIPVLASPHQGMHSDSVPISTIPADPERTKYLAEILKAKKILVTEKRFSCCVGDGGCSECALEASCACGPNLAVGKGVCGQCLDGQHAGIGRIPGVVAEQVKVEPMEMSMAQTGAFSSVMSQEGSGTSWLPASSPMAMRSLGSRSGFDFNLMGLLTLNYADAGGYRGESQFFSTSMAMVMAQRGNLNLRAMGSLDPLINGQRGYPLLFQTGETAHGEPLKDRQHPHDLWMELSATYQTPLRNAWAGFVYVAPVGEPALGTSAFQHRPSSFDNPEAPITHHWNDGTHITYGVITAGLTAGDRWKLDASAFNGREPNENRFDFDPIRLNSYSARISFNPTRNWAFSASHGYLNSPEALAPEENQHRTVGSAFYGNGEYSVGLVFGRNDHGDHATDAWNLEGTRHRGPDTWFSRLELVDKDELVDVPAGTYQIAKWSIGYIRTLQTTDGNDIGIGATLGLYSVPASLRPHFGRNPVSLGVFLRIRPSFMNQ